MYYTHPGCRTSILGENRAYCIRDFTVLITNSKSYMGLRMVPKSVTLNAVMAIILRYFAEFSSFRGQVRKSGCLAINRFSCERCHKVHQLSMMDALCSLW